MGAKKISRFLAVLIAAALVLTSGIGVFAASSPTGGTVKPATSVTVSGKTINVAYAEGATIKYRVKGGKWKTVALSADGSAVIKKLKAGKRYQVRINGKTYYVLIRKGKIKSVKVKGSKATVKIAKRGGAKKYVIRAVDANGRVVTKTVKKLTYKLTLSPGTWTITVTPKGGSYSGQTSAAKTVVVS